MNGQEQAGPPNLPFFKRKLRTGDYICIGLVILLGGGACFLVGATYRRHRQHTRLQTAIPRLCAEICDQRQSICQAIEHYRELLQFYPPDHVLQENPLRIDTVTNQLLYELVGCAYDPEERVFIPASLAPISAAMIKTYFRADRFLNSVDHPAQARRFLDRSNIVATMAVHQKPDVALLAFFPGWEGIEPELMSQIELGSWQYNRSAPVHNPGKYDLWIEIHTELTNIVIGNW